MITAEQCRAINDRWARGTKDVDALVRRVNILIVEVLDDRPTAKFVILQHDYKRDTVEVARDKLGKLGFTTRCPEHDRLQVCW